jgi:hypothetical protein
MLDTIEKDKRRTDSLINQLQNYESWSISYKYSSLLIKKIDSEDIYEICFTVYRQYLNELKYKKLNMKKNYTQIWETMINTLIKGNNGIKGPIHILHQTNQQRIHK